ncbi:MAG: hypothetical protein RLP12_08415, partial [Ekhidna sp.]
MAKYKKRKARARGIAETYIHIKDVPRDLSLEKARLYLEKNARYWARSKFGPSIEVSVRVEEGSLKTWVLVGGTSIFNLVVNYGEIRDGIDHLVSDSRDFSEHVIESFESDNHIPDAAIARTERRLGIPGKIKRFYSDIDNLNSDDLSANERADEIDRLQAEFLEIIDLMPNPDDKQIFIDAIEFEEDVPFE